MWILLSIFFWAALLGYSRIYLGVHYWLDVECGYLMGALCFLVVYAGWFMVQKKNKNTNDSVYIKKNTISQPKSKI